MRLHLLLLTLICSQFAATIGPPAKAGEPSASELIALAPVINSTEKSHRSIEVGGYIKDQKGMGFLKFRALYRSPDRYALMIKDGADDTPLLLASDHKMIVYDPVRPVVVYGVDIRTDFLMQGDEDTLKFGFLWRRETEKGEQSTILFDVKLLIGRSVMSDEVVKTGNGKYRLKKTTDTGNFLVSHIDTSLKQPYTKIEIFSEGAEQPTLCLDKIVLDGTLGDEEFAFPTKERLASKISVRDWPGEGVLKNLGGMALMLRAVYARLGASHPEMREMIANAGFSDINWDDVKKNDKIFSQVLKDLTATKPKKP